jgi:predicted glycosyltransferase involved in capsule biosynthesis
MHDLTDVTFTIPVKIDQPDRVRNLKICIDYLRKNFNTNIMISEMDREQKVKQHIEGITCKYIFMKTESPLFHRTMMLNYMAKQATTPIIVNYDCDVLLPIDNYLKAAESIRSGEKDIVYPYDGNFFDLHPMFIDKVRETNSITFINSTMCRNLRPAADSVGGAVFWSKDKFFKAGLENENFVSWGYEDTERYERATKLGLKVGRCSEGLVHLHHGSSLNSSNGSHPYYQKNEQEWLKVKNMSKAELEAYTRTWRWAAGLI